LWLWLLVATVCWVGLTFSLILPYLVGCIVLTSKGEQLEWYYVKTESNPPKELRVALHFVFRKVVKLLFLHGKS